MTLTEPHLPGKDGGFFGEEMVGGGGMLLVSNRRVSFYPTCTDGLFCRFRGCRQKT